MSLPAKLWSNADLAPQNYGAMQTSPCEIKEPSFFAQQNYRDFVLLPATLWSNADLALQNQGDIVPGANKYHKILLFSFFSIFFCKSFSFPRSLQPLGPLFKEKIFCVTVPLRYPSGYSRSIMSFSNHTQRFTGPNCQTPDSTQNLEGTIFRWLSVVEQEVW